MSPGPSRAADVRLEIAAAPSTPSSERWRHAAEWRDNEDVVRAVGATDGARFRMEMLGFATFEWGVADGPVVAYLDTGADRDLLDDAFSRSVLPFVLHTRGMQVLHASAVLGPRGLYVVCARSGTGKSTLAYALSTRPDAVLWADDAVAFEVSDGGVTSQPLPFSLRLRPASARHFDRADAPLVPGTLRDGCANVATLVVLDRLPADSHIGLEVQRLSDVEAFTAVLEHAYCFNFEGSHIRDTSEAYLGLVANVPVYSLRFAGRLDLIPAIVDELDRLV